MKFLKVAMAAITAIALTTGAQCGPMRPFTVSDGIGVAHFVEDATGRAATSLSPSGEFVAVRVERGLVAENLVEDELRVYDSPELKRFSGGKRDGAPIPLLDLREHTYKEGPIITEVRWLPDSSGLGFLRRDGKNINQLIVVSLKSKQARTLSLGGQDVTSYDIRDATHYVYSVLEVPDRTRPRGGGGMVSWDATGESLYDILLPGERQRQESGSGARSMRSVLWAAVGGEPYRVTHRNGQPIVFYPSLAGAPVVQPALSPNGHTVAAALAVPRVPDRWVREDLPPFAADPYNSLHAGDQNLSVADGGSLVSEYSLIDLRSGNITSLDDEPVGSGSGWWTSSSPSWSADGKILLLPDAYPRAGGHERVISPCAAVFDVIKHTMRCLERLGSKLIHIDGARRAQRGFWAVSSLRFGCRAADTVVMQYMGYTNSFGLQGARTKVFVQGPHGRWHASVPTKTLECGARSLDLYVKESLNAPPSLVVKLPPAKVPRLVWDPNPQLGDVGIGKASVYDWKDPRGLWWTGGLYWPLNYVLGRRYPLVIQTHGFEKERFSTSGVFPTAFAARALAAHGMFVLQVPLCPYLQDPKSGPCEVSGYDAAAKRLSSEGLIDPRRVGIIGFSYTVYTVLEALTTGSVQFAAASVTDGWNYGYWAYLTAVNTDDDIYSRVTDSTVGAKPFGVGLQLWLKRAPDFNMQNVHAPLLVNSLSRVSLLASMWEPYAVLRSLGKPVELVLFHSDEHVLTNPEVRLASQGGSVEWFRFWLQGAESTTRDMTTEYRRWEELCDLQRMQNPGRPTFCVSTGHRKSDRHRREAVRTSEVPPRGAVKEGVTSIPAPATIHMRGSQ